MVGRKVHEACGMSAWADGTGELGPDREFTFAGLRRQLWGTLVVAVVAVYTIGFWVWLLRLAQASAGPSAPVGDLWSVVVANELVGVAVLATTVYHLVQQLRLLRRGSVLVSRVGLAFTDGRGREQRVFWPDLREVRVVAPLSGVVEPSGRLDLRHDAGRIVIPLGLTRADWEELRRLILGLAGLTCETRRWWGVTYTRPAA